MARKSIDLFKRTHLKHANLSNLSLNCLFASYLSCVHVCEIVYSKQLHSKSFRIRWRNYCIVMAETSIKNSQKSTHLIILCCRWCHVWNAVHCKMSCAASSSCTKTTGADKNGSSRHLRPQQHTSSRMQLLPPLAFCIAVECVPTLTWLQSQSSFGCFYTQCLPSAARAF